MNNSWKTRPLLQKSASRLSYRDGLAPNRKRSATRDRRIVTDAKRNRLAAASDVVSRHLDPIDVALNGKLAIRRCRYINRVIPALRDRRDRTRRQVVAADGLVRHGVSDI